MANQDFDEVLDAMMARDPRYHRDAYLFLREGLDYTQQQISKQETGEVRHVSGQELLGGLRAFALEQFGPLAIFVLAEWGIRRCEDFGEMVFNMVETQLLAKTSEDCREDFQGGYNFHDAFRKPFQPAETDAPKAGGRRGTRPAKGKADRAKPPKPKSSDKN